MPLRYLPPLLLTGLCAWLAACSWVGEERMYHMQKDWERVKGPVWDGSVDKLGLGSVWATPQQREAANEQQICGHPNSRNRLVTQNGVSDAYGYRRCALAPYDNAGGSRMGIRPDGQGKVVKN